MKATVDKTRATVPSPKVVTRMLQSWKRIRNRYERSSVWRLAPPEVIATEFISLIRFGMAPRRVECAIYCGHSILAATLPKQLTPYSRAADPPNDEFEFDVNSFFLEGGSAAKQWFARLKTLPKDSWAGVASQYAKHLGTFQRPIIIVPADDGPYTLRLTANGRYAEAAVRSFIDKSGIWSLLQERADAIRLLSGGKWLPYVRQLTDYLPDEFLDRIENELAILIDGQASDIWMLLPDDSGDSVKFHAPRQKLARLLGHYQDTQDGELSSVPAVRNLRQKIDDTESNNNLSTYLAQCDTGYHHYLAGQWDDNAKLTVDHLECIKEKFLGWPTDRGIAETVIASGCGEVVRCFSDDYRVKAYEYGKPLKRTQGESDTFYRTRLAERIFINVVPHLVEIPLLWGLDSAGRGRCHAMLLVLFNNDGNDASDEYALRALSIRDAIEPWYLLLEHHAQSSEWNRIIRGHIIHESCSAFEDAKTELSLQTKALIERRLDGLKTAYSYVKDDRAPERDEPTFSEFVSLVEHTARTGMGTGVTYTVNVPPFSRTSDDCRVQFVKGIVPYLLTTFLAESAALLNSRAAYGMVCDKEQVNIDIQHIHSSSGSVALLEIGHPSTPALAAFIREHGTEMGKNPIKSRDSTNRPQQHLGLFYLGEVLRRGGGGFLPPKYDEVEEWITWTLVFQVVTRKLDAKEEAHNESLVG